MATPKTKFAGKTNPFTGEPTTKRVDASQVTVVNDPIPARRKNGSKYDTAFAALQPGQSLRAPSKSINSISQGLRKWMLNNGQEPTGRVKTLVNYEGDPGFGRVWLLAEKGDRV